ncbi:MAG: glycosyltransferase [Halothiobacillus sp.]|nr:glycosyltransferase [Halothiobacillus sp.]
MRIAIVAPSSVPFVIGGAEKLWWGLQHAIHQHSEHICELIKLPSPERNFWEIIGSYRRFSELNLDHFDRIISTKYPAWMVQHGEHIVYLQHTLRGLYDTYPNQLARQLNHIPAAAQRLLRLLRAPVLDRTALPDIFGAIETLRHADLPPDLLALPGPLLREIVHALDRIALDPSQIRAYHTISATVARREDYFPPHVHVNILPHPSDLPRYETSAPQAIFTISRLERAKRIDLLIQAYLKANIDIPFKIAGTGPEEKRLRAMAAGHPGIQFLGRLSDEEVIHHYAEALFVPFIPKDEDMGLITLEAMHSAKPVLTTTDSGGPTEFIRHGATGLIVNPTVDALAEGFQQLALDLPRTIAKGEAARKDGENINWPRVVDALTAPCAERPRRQRWLILNTFSAWPPDSGGRQRLYHLYRNLARYADIHHICLVPREQRGTWQLAPGFNETHIPASVVFHGQAMWLASQLGVSAWDLTALRHAASERLLTQTLEMALTDTDRVICAHPYLYPAVRNLWHGPLTYDAHNVEIDIKRSMLRPNATAEAILNELHNVERAICHAADTILCCSAEDQARLHTLYDIPPSCLLIVPNGVDTQAVTYTGPQDRQQLKDKLGLSQQNIALFMGSWHHPNVVAAQHIHTMAPQCPNWLFIILGSVCGAPELAQPPANVVHTGVVSEREKHLWLRVADIALNPMTSGGGTNLKMPEYAAAGIPILTTPYGRRGQPLQPGQHCLEAEIEHFPAILNHLPMDLHAQARAAREQVVQQLDWGKIAEHLHAKLAAVSD